MIYTFDEFTLDPQLFELRRLEQRVSMEPQVFDVLQFLVKNRDRVVTKDELLEQVWGDKFISEAALNSRIMSARKALGDTGREQRYIRTVHGRGYRFVAHVAETRPEAEPVAPEAPAAPALARPATGVRAAVAGSSSPRGSLLLGREEEMTLLGRNLAQAMQSSRRVVLISGEAGLGKTTLVEAFVVEAAKAGARVATGQCLEYHGSGEPYMPLLEALGRLARGPDGWEVVEQLSLLAPTWLLQMPSLVEPEELPALQARTLAATRDRMLREILEALDALASQMPLVLVLEDLHWSDHSTLDFLSALARRSDPAKLLLIATYRPADLAATGHPLYDVARELRLRGYCEELQLNALADDAVAAYARRRLRGELPEGLMLTLNQRTAGNPLYVGMVLDSWLAEGILRQEDGSLVLTRPLPELEGHLPESLRAYVEQRLHLLAAAERQTLEAASVAGKDFAAAALAPALGLPVEDVESVCSGLAQRGLFVQARGLDEWRDGTLSEGYSFLHDLYQEVLYAGLPAGRRVKLHQQIGARLEAGYGAASQEKAAELAGHFVRGRVYDRAVHYLKLAGEQALRRSADQDALQHLNQALALITNLPESKDRVETEVVLHVELASAVIASKGWSDPSAEAAYAQALELAQALEDDSILSTVLFAMATMFEVRGDYQRAAQLLQERMSIPSDPHHTAPLESCELMACSQFHQGQFELALQLASNGIELYRPSIHTIMASMGENPGVGCYGWGGLALWFLGYPDRALSFALEGMKVAEQPENRYSLTLAGTQLAHMYEARNEPELALQFASKAFKDGEIYGYANRAEWARILEGWALTALGEGERGIAQMKDAIEKSFRTGALMDHAYYLGLLADAHRRAGNAVAGLKAVDEALDFAGRRGSFFFEAELRRLRGNLLLMKLGEPARAEAESCFRESIAVAREQGAKSLELRAAMDLARLLGDSEGGEEARSGLAAVYQSFEEGFETRDLQDARALLRLPA